MTATYVARAIVTVTGLIPMAVAWLILAPAAHPADIAAGLALVYAATLIPEAIIDRAGEHAAGWVLLMVARAFAFLVALEVLVPDAGMGRTSVALLLAVAAGAFTSGGYMAAHDGL